MLNLYPKNNLFAFEPNPRTYESLKKTLTSYINAQCFCLAANKDDGSQSLFCWSSDKKGELASLFQRPLVDAIMHSSPNELEIQTQKIDSFCQEHDIERIDFMKIDTEGSEMNVLLGAQNMLKNKKIGFIQFEYGGTYSDAGICLKDLYNFLKDYGYTVYKIFSHGLIEISSWDQRLETYKYCNFLASAERLQ